MKGGERIKERMENKERRGVKGKEVNKEGVLYRGEEKYGRR